MTFKDMMTMSVGNLWRRKLRTFLTVLGVLIGTISIVAMLSIAIGMKQMIIDQYSTYGSATQINVSQGYSDGGGSNIDYMLSDSTLEKISGMEHVKLVKPMLTMDVQVRYTRYQTWATLYGVSENELNEVEVGDGMLPSQSKGNSMGILVGNMVPVQFYDTSTDDYDNPYYSTGKILDIDLYSNAVKYSINNEFAENDTNSDEGDTSNTSDGDSVQVVDNSMIDLRVKVAGIMSGAVDEYKNQYSYGLITNIEDMKAYLLKNFKKGKIPGQPLDSNGHPYNEWIYSQFVVEVDEAENVDTVKQSIIDMGFSADSNKDLLESTQKTFKIVELVLGGIGMIAFLVAAIGIANTMMMSTYERTKEIGIMKVLGCDMRDIMGLFLAEAGFIGFLGGSVGTVLTKILSLVANTVLSGALADSGIGSGNISIVPIWLIVIAIIFSTLMGVVAGFFPARRAMKLSPLAAIRNE